MYRQICAKHLSIPAHSGVSAWLGKSLSIHLPDDAGYRLQTRDYTSEIELCCGNYLPVFQSIYLFFIRYLSNYLSRERDFYAEKGVPCPKDVEAETEKDERMKKEEENQAPDTNTNSDYHR